MITFKKIRFKNFLSVGNAFIEIPLDKSQTTLIVGENGGGKCLRGNTEILISFEDEETRRKYEKFMSKA